MTLTFHPAFELKASVLLIDHRDRLTIRYAFTLVTMAAAGLMESNFRDSDFRTEEIHVERTAQFLDVGL